jgi:hypothetical protein
MGLKIKNLPPPPPPPKGMDVNMSEITEASISVMQLQDVWHNLCKHMETSENIHGQVREVINALKFEDRCKLHE